MTKIHAAMLGVFTALCAAIIGCATPQPEIELSEDSRHMMSLAQAIEYPDAQMPVIDEFLSTPPLSLDYQSYENWDLRLDEAIAITLSNSKVLRKLGGAVLRTPQLVPTILGPSILETDPRFGVEAALSAFDAQLSHNVFGEKLDRAVNNRFLSGDGNILQEDLVANEWQISKQSATGATFTARHDTNYDASNVTGNLFSSYWTTVLEGEIRQPLLQGAGWRFNRIAGPQGGPGAINGVVIARLRTDVGVVEVELALRDLVDNVENAYWDLYFAYRDLDAKTAARNASLQMWRNMEQRQRLELTGAEAEKEALAQEQYFRFQEQVQDALTGRLMERTRTNNGSGGGTLRPVPGVHVAERRLRLLMGVPVNDGRLIRPNLEPPEALVRHDWSEIAREAMTRRPELRQQRLRVQNHELELLALKNVLLPRLDAVGQYRLRGFGRDLLDSDSKGKPRFDNAYRDLTSGDFQEWQLGLELSVPIGFRQARVAYRNQQLRLARERSVLHEQQRHVLHNLSNAVADVTRAHAVMKTAFNRLVAATKSRQVLEDRQLRGDLKVDLNLLLETHRRQADANSNYFRTRVEYALAVKNVHFEKGSLMDYNDIFFAEGPWPGKAGHEIGGPGATRPFSYVLSDRLNLRRNSRGETARDEPNSYSTPAISPTDQDRGPPPPYPAALPHAGPAAPQHWQDGPVEAPYSPSPGPTMAQWDPETAGPIVRVARKDLDLARSAELIPLPKPDPDDADSPAATQP